MTWCDKLASTPAVGFKFEPHYAASENILTSIAPVVDSWVVDGRATFTVTQQESFSVHLHHENGFLYKFGPDSISISFVHRLKFNPTSGGLPVGQLISKAMPFTELLDEAIEQLITLTKMLPGPNKRKVLRVGVVSNTTVSEEDLPPGLKRFIEFVGVPWQNKLKDFQIRLVSEIDDNEHASTKCSHTLNKAETKDGLLSLGFDVMRSPKKPKPISEASMKRECERCVEDALQYFEDLAEGSMFNDRI